MKFFWEVKLGVELKYNSGETFQNNCEAFTTCPWINLEIEIA